MTSFKLKLMALSVLVLSFSAPSQTNAQDCLCGDMNGDFIADLADIYPLVQHLIGIPLPGDTFCANLDGANGITLNDLMVELDRLLILVYPAFCDTSGTNSYPTSMVDTIYVPGGLDVPSEQSAVDLPMFVRYGTINGFGPRFKGAYLPVRGLGLSSDSSFILTSIEVEGDISADSVNVSGDTSIILYTTLHSYEPLEQISSFKYTRVHEGASHIAPELVSDVIGRRLVVRVPHRIPYEPEVPQIKTYIPSPCCSAGAGNVDCDPNDVVDITDLTVLIDHLFINFTALCCKSEANIDLDTDVVVDISDLTKLIDHLFISFPPLASCQRPFLDD